MESWFRDHTPIESYEVRGRRIHVKREDLYGIPPAPPLAKLRGLRPLLHRLYESGERWVGCWDTGVSRLGQGLATAACEFVGLHAVVCFPSQPGAPPPPAVAAAQALGAELCSFRPNRIAICLVQARRLLAARGGLLLPFGLECDEAVAAVEHEASRLPNELVCGSTIVVCCGSGVTLAGLLRGLPGSPAHVLGYSAGRSVAQIERCLRRFIEPLPDRLELHPAQFPYRHALAFDCPFPSHPNYDLKAWKHLVDNLDRYPDPILFWNVGA
jgi:hypothetical protein